MKKVLQAQELLVKKGLCASLEDAKRWIMTGKVFIDARRVDKAGETVAKDADVRIKGMRKYVGKGGFKLEGGLSDFGVSVDQRTVLDAGASTGGFTDCLLQHGAKRVYAVDAGHGTLAGKLRNDARVVNLENTNISILTRDDFDPLPSLASVDLSYLSLQEAIPVVANLLEPKGEMLCLVKPLFEVRDPQARRLGKIADPAAYKDVLSDLKRFVEGIGIRVLGITHSRFRGNKGTIEFWLWLSKDAQAVGKPIDINASVEAALVLPDWKKEVGLHSEGDCATNSPARRAHPVRGKDRSPPYENSSS